MIDGKGIDVAQPIWPWGSKTGKNSFFVFLGHFWAYVGQPHGHKGWATSMPFASINSTNPRTNPIHFHKKILTFGDFEKHCFFELAILIFFWFCFIPMKTIKSKFLVYQESVKTLMITLVSSQKSFLPNISAVSVNILDF